MFFSYFLLYTDLKGNEGTYSSLVEGWFEINLT